MNPEVSSGRRRAILALLAITVLIVIMDLTIINVALNPIQQSLNASNAELQWSLDSYLITFAAFVFTAGVCADRFGRKKTLLVGLAIFGISSVLGAYAGTVTELVIWRAVMGVGAAVVPTVTFAIIVNVFPPVERPKAIAAWAAAAGVAVAVGPILGGALLEGFWWGSIFLINAPLVVIAVFLIAWLVPESKNPAPTAFDPLGVALSIVATGLLIYGIVVGGEKSEWLSVGTMGPILGGLALIALLVAVESRMASPSLDVGLLRNSRFSAGTVVIALCFFSLIGALFIMQFYYQAALGFSPMEAGLLLLPMGIGSMVMSDRCPKLVARFGPRAVVTTGAGLMTASFLISSQLTAGSPVWLLVVAQLIFGLGWGCIMAPATGALMSVVPPAKSGAGQAVAQTARQVAGALGIAVIGSVLGVVYRSSMEDSVGVLPEGLREEAAGSIGGTLQAVRSAKLGEQASGVIDKAVESYLSGMQATMFVAAGVTLVAACVALRWLPRTAPQPPSPPVPPVPLASKPTAANEPADSSGVRA